MKNLKWHKQVKKGNCGQIAVAVITGKSVEEIEKMIGHENGTKTKHLAKILKECGFSCPNRLLRLKEPPEMAIAKLIHPLRKGWHWVVIYKNKVYDGVWGQPDGSVKWLNGYRISSYLPIIKKTKVII